MRPEFKRTFPSLLASERRDTKKRGEIPFSLQLPNLATTFLSWADELGIEVSGSSGRPKTEHASGKLGLSDKVKARNSVLRSILENNERDSSDEELDEIAGLTQEETDLLLNAIAASSGKGRETCKACGKSGHSAENCYLLADHLKAQEFLSKNPSIKEAVVKKSSQIQQQRLQRRTSGNGRSSANSRTVASILGVNLNKIDDEEAEDITPKNESEEDDSKEGKACGAIHTEDNEDSSDEESLIEYFDDGAAACNAISFDKENILQEFVDYEKEWDEESSKLDPEEDILASISSMFSKLDEETQGIYRAQVDQGSQVTTTSHRELIFEYREYKGGRTVSSASGHRTKPIGKGYLKVPDKSEKGYMFVRIEHNPALRGTFISPHTIAKNIKGRSSSIVSNYESGNAMLTIHSSVNHHRDIHIPGELRQGLFWTRPLMIPSTAEKANKIPRQTVHINVVKKTVLDEAIKKIQEETEVSDESSDFRIPRA